MGTLLRVMGRFMSWGALTLAVLACAKSTGERRAALELGSLKGVEFGLLEKGSLVIGPDSVSGTGAVIFREPRSEADNNYALSFSLADQGSLRIVSNSNTRLTSGLNLTFGRKGSELKVNLVVGPEKWDLSGDFFTVPADKPLSVQIDVHAHGHTIVWVGSDEFEYAFKTKLAGNFWGLALDKVTLTDARAAKPKKPH